MADQPLRLGTRGSALALAQAESVARELRDAKLAEEVEVVPIRTSGDRDRDRGPAEPGAAGDKARFVREIELALLDGAVDLGVHSAKDLPTELPEGLELAGVPGREDPRDAYVGEASSLDQVPERARIGTSSLRRRAQLLALRPDLELAEVRGNVDTRLERYAAGDFHGLVLAAAGLRRLGRESEIAFAFDPDELVPAPGQGALALEARDGDQRAAVPAHTLTDRLSLARVVAERSAVGALEASCHTPVGAHATIEDGRLRLRAFCGLPDGSEWIRDELTEDASFPREIGERLAERMRAAGAEEILERADRMTAEAGR
ncbi:MAG: hydroxymethylbilane synthase [Solirubrobacterales bacterium]